MLRSLLLIASLSSSGCLLADSVLPFDSAAGQQRLNSAQARADFAPLMNQFQPQPNKIFCGPTTMAMVLNALGLPPPPPQALADIPAERMVARFDPNNVITGHPKTRAQVLGEPMLIKGELRPDFGYQLHQLATQLQHHGAKVTLVEVTNKMPLAQVRQQLVDNLNQRNNYVIVNYHRPVLGQAGGGHISPLAAYDQQSDSFLVLDVNPSAQPWVWVKAEALLKAMATFDTVANRGYLLVGAN